MKSGVYIIEDKERGMYKIGCSKDTYKKRLRYYFIYSKSLFTYLF